MGRLETWLPAVIAEDTTAPFHPFLNGTEKLVVPTTAAATVWTE